MSATTIQNPSTEPCALPFPFAGVLHGRQIVKINVPIATVITALGGDAAASALIITEVDAVAPYDTAYQGSVGLSPVTVAALVATGNSDLQGDVAVGGDFSVGVAKFEVAAATGNTLLDGTFGAAGAATFDAAVSVGTTLLVGTTSHLVGNAQLDGTLIVNGASRSKGALTVDVLTATRVPYIGAAGLIKDEGALTYIEGTDTLNAVNFAGTTATLTGAIQGLGITATADIDAAGGFRQVAGPFTAPGAAGVIAASQTDLDLRYSHNVTAMVTGHVATRAGSIRGLSAQISAAITGAGTTCIAKVTVNGTEVGAALNLSFTQAGAETKLFAVAAKDSVTFAAGDVLGVSYTTTAISNTPALVASLIFES